MSTNAPPTVSWRDRRLTGRLVVLLAAFTLIVYWPVTHCDFVSYDDETYVTGNPHVLAGLTVKGIGWAFTTNETANWHPLTWLSLMLDITLFGKSALALHLVNLAFHTANVVLLFWLLRDLTGVTWRSAAVAAIFAGHPMHVESVAWVAERKDVLSTFFGWLTILFYSRYARGKKTKSPGQGSGVSGSSFFIYHSSFAFCLLCFALGLLCKPMLVTWPFVLLLLDFWPLGRFQPGCRGALICEKIPFFAITVAASVVTFLVQRHAGAMVAVEKLPLTVRCGNVIVSYWRYLGKLFWPTDMAIIYPYRGDWPIEQIWLAILGLGAVTAFLWMQRRRFPFLLVGWLWFCGTLVPVIGLVQVGAQAMADRYTYIPSVGLLIMVVWGADEFTRNWRYQTAILSIVGAAILVACGALTWRQLGYWRDSEALFRHALAVTENNYIAYHDLGTVYLGEGKISEAIADFEQVARLRPDFAQPHSDLASALFQSGETDGAISEFQEAVRLQPADAVAHSNLGMALEKKRETVAAISEFENAIRLKPGYAVAYNQLGLACLGQGQVDAAIQQFQQFARFEPKNAEAHNNLGMALAQKGERAAAIPEFQAALRLRPDYAVAANDLGCLWADRGENLEQARDLVAMAVRLHPENGGYLDSLGWVLFKLHRPAEGLDYLRQAVAHSGRPDPAIYDHLGDVYAALNQSANAAEAWRQSLALQSNPEIQRKLAGAPAR